MTSTHFIGIYDDLEISPNFCNDMISTFHNLSKNNNEQIESNNGNFRTDQAVFLDREDAREDGWKLKEDGVGVWKLEDDGAGGGLKKKIKISLGGEKEKKEIEREDNPNITLLLHTILQQAIDRYVAEHPALNLLSFSANCVKLQKTLPSGGFHNWHSERQAFDLHSKSRVLVWTMYLNDIPQGEGEIEFLELGVRVQPKAGRVVLFPANWCHQHRGNPVYRTIKYIATGWYQESDT